MKKLSLVLLFIILTVSSFSQDYSNLDSITLNDSVQCKRAEEQVLECIDYLLNRPCIEDLNSLYICRFILRWMGQTPDYTFRFDGKLYESIKPDLMLSIRYIACESKMAITDKPDKFDSNFQLKYINMFLEYCEDPLNKVNITSEIKKLIKAKNNDKLLEFIEERYN